MNKVARFYRKAISVLGPQHWWPAESPFEVIIGAILTQNTSWLNVEKAIGNLKENKVLHPVKMNKLSEKKLADIIKPAGYYNLKARRLKNFLRFFIKNYRGSIKRISSERFNLLREKLLSINGVGPETADSILLYALNKPVFVVDAYTKRIFYRHGLIKNGAAYHEVQNLFNMNLRKDSRLFNEYHALLVKIGKDFCLKNNPKCSICPLNLP